MPAFPHVATFLQRVNAVNPTYSRFKNSSLTPLVAILNNPAGTAVQVATAITQVRNVADATFGNKANKYKSALHYLQRLYPIPQPQWVALGAVRSRAVRYTQTALPNPFNAHGPNIYNPSFTQRLQPPSLWEGITAQSVEDFIYRSAAPVGAVLIHMDAHQPGMDKVVDGMRVVDHIKSVLRAIQHRGGGVCALHIGATPPVCPALAPEYNACANRVAVNELGHRHMGSFHAAFNNFVTRYATVVVMGFDADVCVRANLFGAPEYAANAVAGDSSLPPLTSQNDIVTSRALLVATGPLQAAEYGLIRGL
jgi:hypothetical protein